MTTISLQQSKLIKRLSLKKYRKTEGLFIAEGRKLLKEFVDHNPKAISHVYISEEEFAKNGHWLEGFSKSIHSEKDIAKHSQLKTSPGIICLIHIPDTPPIIKEGWTLVLDGVSDPGNVGSIIRIADWFGINQVVCTLETADCFNIKVVQSTMGSLARVVPSYRGNGEIESWLKEDERIVFKAEMEGESVFKTSFPSQGILLMGSESHGVGELFQNLGESVTIPRFGKAESLNVGVATGIICSHIFR
ncbi:RNA methyltransferase [Luteibaculum oceani]|nr:RNA methyltransferase [Luteibaculum oceani]